jgi:hypothetical protein
MAPGITHRVMRARHVKRFRVQLNSRQIKLLLPTRPVVTFPARTGPDHGDIAEYAVDGPIYLPAYPPMLTLHGEQKLRNFTVKYYVRVASQWCHGNGH